VKPQPRASIGRDTVRTFVFNVGAMALSVLSGIIVARALGPVGKGEYSGLQLLQAGMGAVTGGFGAAATYALTKQGRKLSDILPALIVLLIVLSAAALLVIAIVGAHVGFNARLAVFAAVVPAVVVLSWQQGLFLGLGRVQNLNYQQFGFVMLTLVLLVVALVVMHGGVFAAMAAWGTAAYCAAVVTVALIARFGGGGGTPDRAPLRVEVGALVRFGARSALDGLLGFLNYRIDSLVLIAFLGASGFGIYTVAVSAGEALYRVSRSLATASTHRIGSASLAESSATTAKAIRLSTVVVIIGAAALFALAHWIVVVFYGPKFEPAVAALRWLLPGVVAFSSAGIFSAFFQFQLGRPMFMVYLSLGTITLQSILCVLMVPSMGLPGAAIGSSATYLAAALTSTIYFCRVSGLGAREVWLANADDVRDMMTRLAKALNRRPAG
jgi:O-antigen/teichoic acid export membrane protein